MEPTHIEVKGARVHNLRNVSLRLPRGRLICLTGVSGSGKSSLAFDTLYAEGQRRYIESLSSYVRQFLGQIQKPDCDLISGLSPAIAIQQKTAGQNPRSTVGTITAVYDFLRVLYARIGVQHCTRCGRPIAAQTREQIIAAILSALEGRRATVLAPVARGQKGEFRDLFGDLLRAGYVRARVDGTIVELRSDAALEKNKRHDIEVVIDRLRVAASDRARLAEAVETGLRVGSGTLIVAPSDEGAGSAPPRTADSKEPAADLLYSAHYACTACSLSYEPPTPQLFSFNSPAGMCQRCDGLGETFDFDPELMVPDDGLDFLSPCIAPMRTSPGRWRRHIYSGVARHLGIDLRTPWRDLPEPARRGLLFGTGDAHITYEWRWSGGVWKHGGVFEGVIAELREKYRKAGAAFVRGFYEKYMRRGDCPDCRGRRLNPQALAVRLRSSGWAAQALGTTQPAAAAPEVGGSKRPAKPAKSNARSKGRQPLQSRQALGAPALAPGGASRTLHEFGPALDELCAMPVSAALQLIDRLELSPVERTIADEVLKEVRARLEFLERVGLHYLSLDRSAPTLSGGEAQRIRLAGQIGSGLSGVLYVLDEPSIGLHPRDNRRLLESLVALRDLGNTVLVVEHDEETMRAADWLVDFGPGPGVNGGRVVAEGPFERVISQPESLTAQYLRGDRAIDVPARRRPVEATLAPVKPRGTRRGAKP